MSDPISRERALLIGFSTVVFGIVTLMRKVALNRLRPLQFEAISGIIHAALIPLYLALLQQNLVQHNDWDARGMLWSIAAVCLNIVGSIAFMYALQIRNDVGLVSALGSASPIITLMLSALFLGEQPSLKSVIGIGLVLIGVMLASR